jgi:hypothetical protein
VVTVVTGVVVPVVAGVVVTVVGIVVVPVVHGFSKQHTSALHRFPGHTGTGECKANFGGHLKSLQSTAAVVVIVVAGVVVTVVTGVVVTVVGSVVVAVVHGFSKQHVSTLQLSTLPPEHTASAFKVIFAGHWKLLHVTGGGGGGAGAAVVHGFGA